MPGHRRPQTSNQFATRLLCWPSLRAFINRACFRVLNLYRLAISNIIFGLSCNALHTKSEYLRNHTVAPLFCVGVSRYLRAHCKYEREIAQAPSWRKVETQVSVADWLVSPRHVGSQQLRARRRRGHMLQRRPPGTASNKNKAQHFRVKSISLCDCAVLMGFVSLQFKTVQEMRSAGVTPPECPAA